MRPFALIIPLACLIVSPSLSAERIISLSPNLTDLVVSLGADTKLVGVTRFCPVPERAPAVIGDLSRWNVERILSLQPDLLLALASGGAKRPVDHLIRLGLRVALFRIESAEELLAAIQSLGEILNRKEEASRLHDRLASALHPSLEPIRPGALLLVGTHPLYASTPSSYEGDLLERAGWRNVMPQTSRRREKLSPEKLLHLDPDAIFIAEHRGRGAADELKGRLPALRAIRTQSIFEVPPDALLRAGPRADEGVASLRNLKRGGRSP